jgi:hypothetical protein
VARFSYASVICHFQKQQVRSFEMGPKQSLIETRSSGINGVMLSELSSTNRIKASRGL